MFNELYSPLATDISKLSKKSTPQRDTMRSMDETPRAVTWDAPEHHHIEKTGEWFVILAIITIALVVAAILFGNFLFAILVAIAGGTVSLSATRKPEIIPYAVTVRGVRVGDEIHPFPTLESYYIDEDDPRGPQLLVRPKHKFMQYVILPLPEEYIDDIEEILIDKLEEEHLEEPLLMKILEVLGF